MPAKLSVLITTINEGHYLDGCLSRLAFCDEIIVVDLGSKDNSVEMARKYGAKVLFHELVPFAEHVRSYAIANARNDWVLFLDPDMEVPQGLGDKINNLISVCPENVGIIHLPMIKYFKDSPIRYGTKSVVESRAAIINTKRVAFSPLLHYSGIEPGEGIISVGLLCGKSEYVRHYWVDTMAEAYERGRRYIPYEAERRHQQYKHFSLRFMLYEIYKFLSKNLRTKAMKSKISRQILYFDLWYLVNAYKVWISYERKLRRQAKNL